MADEFLASQPSANAARKIRARIEIMTTRRNTQLLLLGTLLLTGIILAQYFQLKNVSRSTQDLKAEIISELRHSGLDLAQTERQQPLDDYTTQGSVREHQANEPAKRESAVEPLSRTHYWISTDYSDDKPYGFSIWLELEADGHFIMEQCFAPDYNVVVTVDQRPYQLPRCKTLADTRINKVTDTEMILIGGRTVPISLEKSVNTPKLSLKLGDHEIQVYSGQKNTLWDGLLSLPSTRNAAKTARDKYADLRMALKAAKGKSSKSKVEQDVSAQ